jgi:hypothetical protein
MQAYHFKRTYCETSALPGRTLMGKNCIRFGGEGDARMRKWLHVLKLFSSSMQEFLSVDIESLAPGELKELPKRDSIPINPA